MLALRAGGSWTLVHVEFIRRDFSGDQGMCRLPRYVVLLCRVYIQVLQVLSSIHGITIPESWPDIVFVT